VQRRLVFVTRYRGFLSVLVVVMHAGIIYGGQGPWYLVTPPDASWVGALARFLSFITRSFVPGAFFFLSGYFVPGSREHRGAWGVLRSKAVRLLIPLAVYTFVANPLLVRAAAAWGPGGSAAAWPAFSAGPLWFLGVLFLFVLLSLGARPAFSEGPAPAASRIPSQPWILLSVLVSALLSFLLRGVFPTDAWISHLPMYVILFAAGIKAGKEQWLEEIASLPIGAWSALAGAGLLLFPALGMRGSFPPGGFRWQSAAFALWDAVTGMGLFIVTLVLFSRARWVIPGTGESFSSSAYALYLLHPPIVVLLALGMRDAPLSPALAWITLSIAGTCLPWGLTAALRKATGFPRAF